MTIERDLRKESALIVGRVTLALAREPWASLPEAQRVDHLPRLADELLRIAFAPEGDRPDHLALLELARLHGLDRRYQGFEEEAILEEYYVLRTEAFTGLRTFHSEWELESIIPRLDAAISVASLASLRGLHGLEAREP